MTKTVRVFEKDSSTADVILENVAQNVVCVKENADLGIVMPGFTDKVHGEYGILLVPQSFKHECTAMKIFTYGMEMDSIITLSSVGDEKCIMTVQKEICDIWGETIEPQDIVISRRHFEPDAALATAAAFMIVRGGEFFCGI